MAGTPHLFDTVVDEYAAARPAYPARVLDALGPLRGLRVLEGGVGTGIATRQLLERGAAVVGFDLSWTMFTRAAHGADRVRGLVADGARLPFRDGCADLICFAQSWHWLDGGLRCDEAARVLRSGGRWAGWWSHARADGEAWFDEYWSVIESRCPGTHRSRRDTDWGHDLDRSGRFAVDERITVPWVRRLSVDDWLTDQRSHSFVATLPDAARERLMADLVRIVRTNFPDGVMDVRYETWMWIAHR